jgi:hypothetical protein
MEVSIIYNTVVKGNKTNFIGVMFSAIFGLTFAPLRIARTPVNYTSAVMTGSITNFRCIGESIFAEFARTYARVGKRCQDTFRHTMANHSLQPGWKLS